MPDPPTRKPSPLREVAAVFCKLGMIGFGGPAVVIGMLEDDVVRRRGWITRERLLDLVGATNIIPGPNAVEMCMHLGHVRAGWMGLLVAGVGFIVPAALCSTALAWAYVEYGTLPQVQPFLYGIKPAVLALILSAVWRLGKAGAKSWQLVVIGVLVLAAYFLGANEVLALLAGGLVGTLWLRLWDRRPPTEQQSAALVGTAGAATAATAKATGAAVASGAGASLWKVGLLFLKVGAVMYGSGYVLVAFMEGDFVNRYQWLTHQELLDGIAVGQFTPGPLLSAATFVGYLILGAPGAVVATVAIVLPSFVFVAVLNRVLPRLRESAWASRFMDAVNISAVGLMLAVTAKLARQALTSWPAWLIAVAAGVAAIRFRVGAPWLVLGGSLAGWVLSRWAA